MVKRRGKSGSSGRFYILRIQNHDCSSEIKTLAPSNESYDKPSEKVKV